MPQSLIVFLWLVFILYWLFSAIGAKRTARNPVWWKGGIIRILIAVILVIFLNQPRFQQIIGRYSATTGSSALGYVGVLLCALGIAFAVWARRHLGKNWGMPMTIREQPELVTSGPYAYVRHPIYTGILLASLGSALAIGLPWVVIFIIFFFYFTFSAKTEEKNMAELFPNQYPQYK